MEKEVDDSFEAIAVILMATIRTVGFEKVMKNMTQTEIEVCRDYLVKYQ